MNPYRYESKIGPMTRAESAAWPKIEKSFRSAKLVAPRKGFSNRWMHLQGQHQLVEKKRREIWLALGNGTAILAFLGVIAITIWPVFDLPGSIFTSALEIVFETLTFILVLADISLSVFQVFPLLVWFTIALAFFGLVALWASLFSRVTVENR